MIALGEVGAADGACKEHIADKRALGFAGVEDNVTRGVPRAVAYGQCAVADRHGVTIHEPARRSERVGVGQTKHRALLRQCINPELVSTVWPGDGKPMNAGKLRGSAGMVDMGMRDPDLSELNALTFDLGKYPIGVTTWINDDRLACLVAPEQ